MSPRKNRRTPRSGGPGPDGPPAAAGWQRPESGPDGDWLVRTVPGAAATKVYRCPGCDHEIGVGVPHLVAWQAGALSTGVADRRHWHTPCWRARSRRRR